MFENNAKNDTIRSAHDSGKRTPAEISSEIAAYAADEPFMEQEVEVIRQASEGCSNKIVAAKLESAKIPSKTTCAPSSKSRVLMTGFLDV